MGLGIGYLVVDVLLPILLLSIIWPYLITPVLKLLYGLTFDTLGLLGSYLLPSRKPKQKKQ